MRYLIVLLDIFLAISGFFGGRMLLKDPSGSSMRMPLKWLDKVPLIKNYFWPGMFLLVAFAFGASTAAVVTAYNYFWWREMNISLGIILMSWIVAELLFISEKAPIQLVYFILGFLLVTLSIL